MADIAERPRWVHVLKVIGIVLGVTVGVILILLFLLGMLISKSLKEGDEREAAYKEASRREEELERKTEAFNPSHDGSVGTEEAARFFLVLDEAAGSLRPVREQVLTELGRRRGASSKAFLDARIRLVETLENRRYALSRFIGVGLTLLEALESPTATEVGRANAAIAQEHGEALRSLADPQLTSEGLAMTVAFAIAKERTGESELMRRWPRFALPF